MPMRAVSNLALCMLMYAMVKYGYGFSVNNSECKILEDDLGYHLYHDHWPTGAVVSRCGRKFSCYPASDDVANTNDGCNGAYQVAETRGDREVPYPDFATNNPPGGAIDYTKCPPVTKGLSNYFLGVSRIVIDDDNNPWVMDNGRARGKNHEIYEASPGGAKLVGIDLYTDRIFRTCIFPRSIATPQSFFTDLQVDTRYNKAYFCDPMEYAIVVLDLHSGETWRVLHRHPSLMAVPGALPFVWGAPCYDTLKGPDGKDVIGSFSWGVHSLALTRDARRLYYSQLGGRILYSVETTLLQSPYTAPGLIAASVENHGEKGVSTGLACDSDGNVWSGCAEQDAISVYNPCTRKTLLYIRDKRINWASQFSIPGNGYVYFMDNQLSNAPYIYPGKGPVFKDRRKKPFVLFRFKLPEPYCCS